MVLLKFGHVFCRTALARKRDTLECTIKKDHTGFFMGEDGRIYILCLCSSAVFFVSSLYSSSSESEKQ